MMTQQEAEAIAAELMALGAQTCNLGEEEIYLAKRLLALKGKKIALEAQIDTIMANLTGIKNVLSDEEKAS